MPLELASLSEDKGRERETKEHQEKEGKGKEAEVDEVVYITVIYRMCQPMAFWDFVFKNQKLN